ncbi:MAG: hypothetical protein C0601_12700 [Candidatus Muiribacterium halophilum]|uniref:Uncharacterized protein n=1 Tax=Muiribacterium halophilum TaxID=2053465 RepID=A0A2N5Z9Z3_MUIH1|nr:MAG: hypothetical protein C0601_12700 [Candidatus Muirbacterium halophilum]
MGKSSIINRFLILKKFELLFSSFAIVFCTFFRELIFPLIFCFPFLFKKKKLISVESLLFLFYFFLMIIFRFLLNNQLLLKNYLLSFYFYFPLILIFFSKPFYSKNLLNKNLLSKITTLLVFFNLIGFFQFFLSFIKDGNDTGFLGLYGGSGLAQHGYGILNAIISLYYFATIIHTNQKKNKRLFVFFFLSFIFSFYSLGIIFYIFAIIFFFLFYKKKIKKKFIFLLIIFLLIGSSDFKPVKYARNTIVKIYINYIDNRAEKIPRKFLLYKEYFDISKTDFSFLLFGNGPGTFNSRSSFLLNGDYSTNFIFKKNKSMSYKMKTIILPLWNQKISSIRGKDGVKNQPFSSFISTLSEYGLLFFLLFFYFFIKRIKKFIAF